MNKDIHFKQQQFDLPRDVLAAFWSKQHQSLVYLLLSDLSLVCADAEDGQCRLVGQLEFPEYDREKPLSIALSGDDRYLCLFNTAGRFARLYELSSLACVYSFNRGDYYTETTCFPLLFTRYAEVHYLIHASDWNRLELLNLDTLERSSAYESQEQADELLPDYFYGSLTMSPGAKYLVSSGWVWQPVSALRFVDLQAWLGGNLRQQEQDHESNLGIWSYAWDRPLCWLDDTTMAYLYHSNEEGLDAEGLAEEQLEADTGYILVYDVEQGKDIRKLVFEGFVVDEHSEVAEGECIFHHQGQLLCSGQQGSYYLDAETGEILSRHQDVYVSQYSAEHQHAYHVSEKGLLVYC